MQRSGTHALRFRFLSDEELEAMPFDRSLVTNPVSASKILSILSATAPTVGSDSDGLTVFANYGTAIMLRVHPLAPTCQRFGQGTFPNGAATARLQKLHCQKGSGNWKSSGRMGPWGASGFPLRVRLSD